jgi:hypothetical protein
MVLSEELRKSMRILSHPSRSTDMAQAATLLRTTSASIRVPHGDIARSQSSISRRMRDVQKTRQILGTAFSPSVVRDVGDNIDTVRVQPAFV